VLGVSGMKEMTSFLMENLHAWLHGNQPSKLKSRTSHLDQSKSSSFHLALAASLVIVLALFCWLFLAFWPFSPLILLMFA
jgi:hypothetical protein